jgi:hypothetical protein
MTLALFIAGMALLTLYGLTVSGHFPFEARSKELQSPIGTFVIGATLLSSGLAALLVIVTASNVLPWTAIIIGGGAALLAGPLLLRGFPDDFVDGLGGMVSFALAAVFIAVVLWATH